MASAAEAAVAAQAAAEHSAQVAERVGKLRLKVTSKNPTHAKAKEDGKAANAEVMATLHQSMHSKHAQAKHAHHTRCSMHSARTTEASRTVTDIHRRSFLSVASSGRRSNTASVALSHQDVLEDGVKVKTESHRLRRQISGFGINSAVSSSPLYISFCLLFLYVSTLFSDA